MESSITHPKCTNRWESSPDIKQTGLVSAFFLEDLTQRRRGAKPQVQRVDGPLDHSKKNPKTKHRDFEQSNFVFGFFFGVTSAKADGPATRLLSFRTPCLGVSVFELFGVLESWWLS